MYRWCKRDVVAGAERAEVAADECFHE